MERPDPLSLIHVSRKASQELTIGANNCISGKYEPQYATLHSAHGILFRQLLLQQVTFNGTLDVSHRP